MKKLYILFVFVFALLINVFAQSNSFTEEENGITTTTKVEANNKEPFIKPFSKSAVTNKGTSYHWYNYAYAVEEALSQSKLYWNNIYPDTTARVKYTSGYDAPWIHAIGTVIDPKSQWFSLSPNSLGITDSTNYNLDSLGFLCRYYRNYPDTSIKDTLIFDIIYDKEEMKTGCWNGSLSGYPGDTICYRRIYFNPSNDMYGEYYDKSTGTLTRTNVVRVKKVLSQGSVNDTTSNGRQYYQFATPEVPEVKDGNALAISIQFVPGHVRTQDTDTTGVNVNHIRFYSYEENGENTYPSYTKDDWNYSGYVRTSSKFDPSSSWYGRVIPRWAYTDSYHYENHLLDLCLSVTNTIGIAEKQVDNISVKQNYPNPFDNNTNITYTLEKSSNVSLEVFDITGRKISDLTEGVKKAGTHTITLSAKDYAEGMYYYSIISDNNRITRKMMVVK